jgi:hypothetical protein
MGYPHVLSPDAGRPQRSNEYEWDYICDTTLGDVPPDKMARLLSYSTFQPLQGSHAYSPEELRELRSILRLRGDMYTDIERLRCESNKFAVLVGWQVKGERQLTGTKRADDVRKRLLSPADKLLKLVTDDDFSREFGRRWGRLTENDHAQLQNTLRAIIAAATAHISAIEEYMGPGKSWDYDLKRLHVHLTACFCEFFNSDFEPSRMSGGGREEPRAFQEAVELLAKPTFPAKRKGSGFLGAIRDHIDDWNDAKRPSSLRRMKADLENES